MGNVEENKKRSVEDNLKKMRAIIKAQKVTSRKFKIKRAVFIKVEK